MERPYNDRWERTKRHLQRNLIDYHDLSPIAEESRSDSSDDRPCSPLPDLIVEREPNRHDHSEEFYEALAVRMRRYYKRLFIDGVSEPEVSLDDAEDIPDFEINRSMASTFIIDTNNDIDEERHKLVADANNEEFDSIINEDEIRKMSKIIEKPTTFLSSEEKSDARNVTDDKEKRSGTHESSHDISTLSDAVTNEDESEVNNGVNKYQATQTPDKEASKSIETESDLVETCHETLTTVAQVHGEVPRVRAPRVFEDGSPVLMPKAHQLSRSVFGNMSHKARKIMISVHDDEEDREKGGLEEIEGYDKNIQQVSEGILDFNQPKIIDENSDLEVEWLSADCVPKESQELIETCEEEENFEDINRNQTLESTSLEVDDEDSKAIEDDSESPLRTSESDGIIQIQNEESIGPNEFDGVEFSPKARHLEIQEEEILEPAESSFEMALRKGLFETKNARINSVSSSDVEFEDDSYENYDFEPVEVMRGTMQTRPIETLRRESTLSKDSPLVKAATHPTAEALEEDNFEPDDIRINASDAVMTGPRDEGEDRSLEVDLTTSQDGSGTDGYGTDDGEACNLPEAAEELSFPSDLESVINAPDEKENENSDDDDDDDTNTPSVTKIRSIADVCDEIWSVSPVNINFEELPPQGHDLLTPSRKTDSTGSSHKKRASDLDLDVNAPVNKKKRCNIAIQTGASQESTANWDNLKNNFFVGKPLVYRLCSCHDHVCL